MMRRWIWIAVLVLAGCSNMPEPGADSASASVRLGLKLAPSALGTSIALQQHLTVERGGRIDELDTALEVDAEHIELIGLAFGQRVLRLHYDGKQLTSWRHVMLPAQVRAEDVLEDLQLTQWPLDAISQALPAGWRIEERGLHRTLYMGDTAVIMIEYSGLPRWSGTTVLQNYRYHYRLTIQSAPVGIAPQPEK